MRDKSDIEAPSPALAACSRRQILKAVKEIDEGFAGLRVQGARAPEALLERHDVGANLGTSSAGGHGLSPLPRTPAR